MARILLLSNGHGEDYSGSIIGKNLLTRNHKVDALPIVGNGKYYIDEGIKIIVALALWSPNYKYNTFDMSKLNMIMYVANIEYKNPKTK